MSSLLNRFLRGAAFSAVVLSAMVALSSEARAGTVCAPSSDYLRLYDAQTGQSISVCGNNPSWAAFGWANRADVFRNASAAKTACIYPNINYTGVPMTLPRGMSISRTNYGRSNRWATLAMCTYF